MAKHVFSTDAATRAAREVCEDQLEHAEDISNLVVYERLEESSREGGPSLLRSCIDRRVENQVALEKTKLLEEMRAAVKSEVKDQIGLDVEIGRSLASAHNSITGGSEYAMPEDISDHLRYSLKYHKSSKRNSIKEEDAHQSRHSSSSSNSSSSRHSSSHHDRKHR